MFNFRIVPSVLFASVLVSSVGLTANAQKAPDIKTDPFSIEGFRVQFLENSQASYGRNLTWKGVMYNNEDGEHRLSGLRSYDDIEFTEEELLVNYSNREGFKGLYSWEGESGEITTDVSVDVNFGVHNLENGEIGARVTGYIGKDTNNLVFGDHDFGHIEFSGYFDPSTSKKVAERFTLKNLGFSNGQFYVSPSPKAYEEYKNKKFHYFNFSQDSDNTDYPTYVQGMIGAYISNDNTLDKDNGLIGVFVAKASETDPINPFNNDPSNTPEPTVEEPDPIEEFSGANGWRDIDYTAQEIKELGIPDKLLDEDDTKIGLERTTDGGLSRENHVSLIRHANPTFQLWGVEEGRRGFPHHHQPKKAEGCRHGQICAEEKASIIYSAQFKNHFDKLEELSEDDKKIWQKEVTTAIGKGYLQWIHHLDYNPGHLDVSLDDKREYNYNTKNHEGGGLFTTISDFVSGRFGDVTGEALDIIIDNSKTLTKELNKLKGIAIGSTVVWNPALSVALAAITESAEKLLEKGTTEERTLFSTIWLDKLYAKYKKGEKEDVRQELITEATRTGGDEFGFIYPYATSFPNTPLYHPNNIGSVMNKKSSSETSYNNFGVIRQDVERIPDGNYNNSYAKQFDIHKTWQRRFWFNNTFTARYGAWLTHEFKIEGVNGESSFKETDMISARPYFQANDHLDDKIPTVSATYSGEDNFLGVDMSAHFLGAVLEADAQVIYNYSPDSPLGSSATVTIDNFRVFTGETITGIPSIPTIDPISKLKRNKDVFAESWRSRNGSISYTLSCGDSSCNSPDNKTAELTFYGGERYAGGTISDRENEYVGGFIAERE